MTRSSHNDPIDALCAAYEKMFERAAENMHTAELKTGSLLPQLPCNHVSPFIPAFATGGKAHIVRPGISIHAQTPVSCLAAACPVALTHPVSDMAR